MGWLLILIVMQSVIAAVVILVLKHLLDKELIEAALEKLQAASGGLSGQVKVKSAKDLNSQIQHRIQSLLRGKETKVIFELDPSLKGGLRIEFSAGNPIDCSMAGRLKNLWP